MREEEGGGERGATTGDDGEANIVRAIQCVDIFVVEWHSYSGALDPSGIHTVTSPHSRHRGFAPRLLKLTIASPEKEAKETSTQRVHNRELRSEREVSSRKGRKRSVEVYIGKWGPIFYFLKKKKKQA